MSERGRAYRTEAIVVYYQPRLCIHAAACVRGLPQVFDPSRKPWIQPELATPDALAEVVARCPSGALQFERLDGGASEPRPNQVNMRLWPGGPLEVRGRMVFRGDQGQVVWQTTRATLCRCGASKNKPFCDNSHLEAGFEAEAAQIDLGPEPQ